MYRSRAPPDRAPGRAARRRTTGTRRGAARPGGRAPAQARQDGRSEAEEHLAAFAASRRGVEGFVEPETPTTPTTLVLVAGDGEWTRRRAGSPKDAFALGGPLGLPVYDVAAVGYPARMREWTARRRPRRHRRP